MLEAQHHRFDLAFILRLVGDVQARRSPHNAWSTRGMNRSDRGVIAFESNHGRLQFVGYGDVSILDVATR